ncbi:YbaB/EbfC family nucleoid-associated protein [Phytomonospora endophytica]|uniref:DNA-binding protein YbaB n=1 Tax=Phytomonospora endophytica TaxID=714109 RepID=A0A841FJP3_9ACTN|nr:YbaB/EbfC family nucleoid-associated protein [Phytomonospora endophytica]MBB6036055.1 DNA-binding protein YbaB [Phytomonospora endophytica]GIG66960.1 hypothetical protein Pen01_32550 [Phytomonospora endophytica]
MDNPLMDVEGARERLEAWKADAERRAAATQAAGEGLQALRIKGSDDYRIVEITIDSSGSLVDVQLAPQVQRQSPEQTRQAILAAHRDARVKLAEAAAEVVRETIGENSATGRALLAGFQPRDTEPDDPADHGREWR